MDAMQILVIILSIFLALFLSLSIVLTIVLIRIARQVRAMTDSALHTVEKVEGIAANISTATNITSLAKIAKAFVTNFKK